MKRIAASMLLTMVWTIAVSSAAGATTAQAEVLFDRAEPAPAPIGIRAPAPIEEPEPFPTVEEPPATPAPAVGSYVGPLSIAAGAVVAGVGIGIGVGRLRREHID